jgi:hypothetical protein
MTRSGGMVQRSFYPRSTYLLHNVDPFLLSTKPYMLAWVAYRYSVVVALVSIS